MTPTPQVPCAICGVKCVDIQVNRVALCDPHFDEWLTRRKDLTISGLVEMAEFVAAKKLEAKSKAVAA